MIVNTTNTLNSTSVRRLPQHGDFAAAMVSIGGAGSLANRAVRPQADDHLTGAVSPSPSQHQRIEEQARKWVAQTFYGQILKQMRNSPFKTDLSSGGRGGEAFGGLLDQQLADHMSRSAGSKLVNSIVRRMEARAGYAKQTMTGGARAYGDGAVKQS